jgi:hypothetical protein
VPNLAIPGPGGFHGGSGYYAFGVERSAGFGVGGGSTIDGASMFGASGGGGSYGTSGQWRGTPYGNPSLIPLIGGSGGGGDQNVKEVQGGGAGGGAILIACGRELSLSGQIRANGGSNSNLGGGGSGGGIRLIAETLTGTGTLRALGGAVYNYNHEGAGGLGRISVSRVTDTSNIDVVPQPFVVTLLPEAVPQIWPPADAPTVVILSVGGVAAPADPRAGFGTVGADIVLPRTATTTVVLRTTHAVTNSVVTVRATPRANGNYSEVIAKPTQIVTEDPMVVLWTAENVPVLDGYAAVQAKVVRP